MPRHTHILATLLVLTGGAVVAQGKSLAEGATPAELPPASFEGRQYVDSDGCVYVRAGFDGAVQWVPRVTRDRQVVCGQTPTLQASAGGAARPAPAPAPETRVQAEPRTTVAAGADPEAPKSPARTASAVAAGADPVSPKSPAAQPVRRVQRQATAPKMVRQVPRMATTYAAPTQQIVVAGSHALGAAPHPVQGYGSLTHQGVPTIVQGSARDYLRGAHPSTWHRKAPRGPVFVAAPGHGHAGSVATCPPGHRCGPQTQHPMGGLGHVAVPQPYAPVAHGSHGGATQVIVQAAPNTRVAAAVPPTPPGFRPVWEDGRLNPLRGLPGSQAKIAGQVSGEKQLRIVRVSPEQQARRAATAAQVVVSAPQTVQQVPQHHAAPAPLYAWAATPSQAARPTVTYSTKSLSPRPSATVPQPVRRSAAAVTGRSVQIATFANPANAQRTAQKMAAQGLPIRIGTYRKRGQVMRVILAGPFASEAQVQSALGIARRNGFHSAYAR
ncbi:MAG: SPOR domain-containing protein [Shimia sp.]